MTHTLILGWDRTLVELRMYLREKESVFFSFLFPILMLSLFAIVFEPNFTDGKITAARFFLPGMVAAGVLLTSFQTMALSVATERDDGTLKRLRATPMPPVAYFLGKVGLVAITSIAQVSVLLLVARGAFGVALPTDPGRWVTFAWVFLLGVTGGTVLGIAYSSLASARSMGAVVIAPLLVLQFISGVYFAWRDIPEWLQQIATVFPLKWIAQGMRSVFFPAGFEVEEVGGSWALTETAIWLGGWAIIGLALCVTTFRWFKRGTT